MDEIYNIVKVGDEVTVIDLSNYLLEFQPKLPVKGKIVRFDPYPYFVVEIDGKEFEVYEGMIVPN